MEVRSKNRLNVIVGPIKGVEVHLKGVGREVLRHVREIFRLDSEGPSVRVVAIFINDFVNNLS